MSGMSLIRDGETWVKRYEFESFPSDHHFGDPIQTRVELPIPRVLQERAILRAAGVSSTDHTHPTTQQKIARFRERLRQEDEEAIELLRHQLKNPF